MLRHACSATAVMGRRRLHRHHDQSGVIKHTGTVQGSSSANTTAGARRAPRLLDACKRSGINAELSGDIRREEMGIPCFWSLFGDDDDHAGADQADTRESANSALSCSNSAAGSSVAVRARARRRRWPPQTTPACRVADSLPADMASSYHDLRRGNPLGRSDGCPAAWWRSGREPGCLHPPIIARYGTFLRCMRARPKGHTHLTPVQISSRPADWAAQFPAGIPAAAFTRGQRNPRFCRVEPLDPDSHARVAARRQRPECRWEHVDVALK